MNPDLYRDDIEEIITSRPYLGPAEKETARKYLRRLIKNAKPGNIPWKILENEFGFSPDYVPGQDEGGDPPGTPQQ